MLVTLEQYKTMRLVAAGVVTLTYTEYTGLVPGLKRLAVDAAKIGDALYGPTQQKIDIKVEEAHVDRLRLVKELLNGTPSRAVVYNPGPIPVDLTENNTAKQYKLEPGSFILYAPVVFGSLYASPSLTSSTRLIIEWV